MPALEVFLLALALSMDAFAVAIAVGISLCTVNRRQYFRLSFHFGLFQCIMPIFGWILGMTIREEIEQWDHWVAFGLLLLVGLHMIKESFDAPASHSRQKDPTKGFPLIVLALATSIDALAVGLSLALLGESIWLPACFIGVICALLTFIGMRIGCIAAGAQTISSRAGLAGGSLLILLGLNILREHGVFT